MGVFNSKQWDEMLEVNGLEEEAEQKTRKDKLSLRDKVRTRILRTDPRSASDEVERTPIAVQKNSDSETPLQPKLKTLAVDPRSPSALERTPIVVEEVPRRRTVIAEINQAQDDSIVLLCSADDPRSPAVEEVKRTPLYVARGQPPPELVLPPEDPLSTPLDDDDPRSPSYLSPRTPITTATPATVDLDKLTDRGQPRKVLQHRFREAVAALHKQEAVTTPAAADSPGHLTPAATDSPGDVVI